jgi:hypothetical protein
MLKTPILTTRYAIFLFILVLLFNSCDKKVTVLPQTFSTVPKDSIVVTPQPPSKKWVVSTVAGSTTPGLTDGDTTQVQFSNAQGIVADNHGNIFVGDQGNFCIRQVTYAGHVTTYETRNGGNPNLSFGNIYSIAIDGQGNLYTIDYDLIRRLVSPTYNYVFAGSLSVNHLDGTGTNAAFNVIGNMAIDSKGNIFVPDYDMSNNFILRKVTADGVVSTLTLQDNTGYSSNGLPNSHYLYAIAVDPTGNIYVTGNGNCLIKKVDTTGNVTIFAGSSIGFKDGYGTKAQFYFISAMTCDASGNLWVSDCNNHSIRKVTPNGTVTTIAGKGTMGYLDGDGKNALFKYPFGITVDNTGVIYVMDNGNNRVRKLEYK